MFKDFSISAVIAGLIAVAISFAGPSLIIFQAAALAHLDFAHTSSWIWAVSIGSGLSGLLLSLRFKVPVITAWSTPGAALLLGSLPAFSFSDAIGAYLFAASLIVFLAWSGLFDSLMKKIPKQIAAAMLAGILFRFASDVFSAMPKQALMALPMFAGFIVLRKLQPRYAIPGTLLIGILIAISQGLFHFENIEFSLAQPIWTTPTFSLSAIFTIGLPLALVTMSGQFVPGIAVMRNAGYTTPSKPMVLLTSLFSVFLAPFGSHGINLAAITAAICTGRESHEDPSKRYVSGIVCGLAYIVIGLFGGTLVLAFTALPKVLVSTIAGLALVGALMSSLAGAMQDESEREGALITFLVTSSGMVLWGLGAPFWGLAFGLLTRVVLQFWGIKIFTRVASEVK